MSENLRWLHRWLSQPPLDLHDAIEPYLRRLNSPAEALHAVSTGLIGVAEYHTAADLPEETRQGVFAALSHAIHLTYLLTLRHPEWMRCAVAQLQAEIADTGAQAEIEQLQALAEIMPERAPVTLMAVHS